jgi:hypothetical protein
VLFNGFRPLFQALDPESVNQAAFEVVQVLQGEGGTIESLTQKTASLTNTLADKDEVIGRVIDNLTAVLATVDDRGTELSDLIVQLRRLSAASAEDREVIGASLDGINELTGATADRSSDVREPLRQDITELRTARHDPRRQQGDHRRRPVAPARQARPHRRHGDLRLAVQLLPVRPAGELPGSEKDPLGLVGMLTGPINGTQFVNSEGRPPARDGGSSG